MKKLALINQALDETNFRKGNDSLTLNYLNKTLEYETILLPTKEFHKNNFKELIEDISTKIIDCDLVGISTNTFSKPYAKKLQKYLKLKFPEKTIELGGQGIYEIKNKIKVPTKIIKPIILFRKNLDKIDIEMVLTNLCPQGCGYCNTPKNQIPIPVKDYISEIKNKKNIRRIILYDNNPLHPDNFLRTHKFFTLLKKEIGYIPDSVFYCDPALLTNSNQRNNIIEFLKKFENRNSNLFIGRERPDQEICDKIKRRVNGKIRDQTFLDSEKKGLLEVAKMLKTKFDSKKGLNFMMVLNYILTPFETRESTQNLINEVKEFMPYKKVLIKSNFLWVFPFTQIYHDYKGKFMSVDQTKINLKLYNYENLNFWKQDFENSIFLDLCNALNARLYYFMADRYNSWYNLSMIKIASAMSFNEFNESILKNIVSEIPKDLKKLKIKFNEFEKIIFDEKLHIINTNNLIKLLKYSNKIFYNTPIYFIEQLTKEFEQFLTQRNSFF